MSYVPDKKRIFVFNSLQRPPSHAILIPDLCRSTSKLFQEPTAEDNNPFAQFQERPTTTDAGRRITDMVLEN